MRDWEKAKQLLEKEGFVVKVTDMVAVEVADRPGGLAEILDVVEKAGINVEFMYAFTEKRENQAVLIFRFDDPDSAIQVLQRTGLNVVASVDLLKQIGRMMNLSENIKRCFKHDRFAAHSNIELLTVAPGHATAKMVLHPHHLNGLGTVQGGAIFTLADFMFRRRRATPTARWPWRST